MVFGKRSASLMIGPDRDELLAGPAKILTVV
jgi:hypothetical protein